MRSASASANTMGGLIFSTFAFGPSTVMRTLRRQHGFLDVGSCGRGGRLGRFALHDLDAQHEARASHIPDALVLLQPQQLHEILSTPQAAGQP